MLVVHHATQIKVDPGTLRDVETAAVHANVDVAQEFPQDQIGQQGAWQSSAGSDPSYEEMTTDPPAHTDTAMAIRWATRLRGDNDSVMSGYCCGGGTSAPPTTTAGGKNDHCAQA